MTKRDNLFLFSSERLTFGAIRSLFVGFNLIGERFMTLLSVYLVFIAFLIAPEYKITEGFNRMGAARRGRAFTRPIFERQSVFYSDRLTAFSAILIK